MFDRAVSSILERGLAGSPRAAELCASLVGQRVALQITGVPWSFVIESTGASLQLAPAPAVGEAAGASEPGVEARIAATITGGPFSLLALTRTDAQELLQRGDLRIDGDVEVAGRFRELARLLRPDLEALLGRLIGRLPAHLLARAAASGAHWGRDTARTAMTNVAEYLAHERGTLVPHAEAESFMRGVEQLREQIDRVDARAQLLEQQSTRLAGIRRAGA